MIPARRNVAALASADTPTELGDGVGLGDDAYLGVEPAVAELGVVGTGDVAGLGICHVGKAAVVADQVVVLLIAGPADQVAYGSHL